MKKYTYGRINDILRDFDYRNSIDLFIARAGTGRKHYGNEIIIGSKYFHRITSHSERTDRYIMKFSRILK